MDGVILRGKVQPNFVLLVIIAGSFISNITISATGTGYVTTQLRCITRGILPTGNTWKFWIMDGPQ